MVWPSRLIPFKYANDLNWIAATTRTPEHASVCPKQRQAMDWSVVCCVCAFIYLCWIFRVFSKVTLWKGDLKYPNVFHLYLDPGFRSIHSIPGRGQSKPKVLIPFTITRSMSSRANSAVYTSPITYYHKKLGAVWKINCSMPTQTVAFLSPSCPIQLRAGAYHGIIAKY